MSERIYPDPVELEGTGLEVTRCPDCGAMIHVDYTTIHDAHHRQHFMMWCRFEAT